MPNAQRPAKANVGTSKDSSLRSTILTLLNSPLPCPLALGPDVFIAGLLLTGFYSSRGDHHVIAASVMPFGVLKFSS